MLALQASGELNNYESNALEKLYSILSEAVDKLERFEWFQTCQADISLVSDGSAGQSQFDISFSLLRTLLEDGFAVPNIAGILGEKMIQLVIFN